MRAVRAEARGVAAAVAFLTRLPVGRLVALEAVDVARGAAVFPLVGAALGAVVGALADALAPPLTAPLAAALALATGTVLTGALHLDALADSADALGAPTAEQGLRIMRDHAVGAYGATALVFDLVLKVTALSVLAERGDALRFAVPAAAVGRAAPLVLGVALPYARPGGGLGRAVGATGWVRCAAALAVAVTACVLLRAAVLVTAAAVVVVVGLTARRRFGGVTGDVLGAAAELTETAAIVIAVAAA